MAAEHQSTAFVPQRITDKSLLALTAGAQATLERVAELEAALARLVAVHDSDAEDDDGEAWGPALAAAREALAE